MLRRGTGSGYETGREFGRELNGKRGLIAKVLHLAREYRSPNQDQELSAGELNGREMEARRLTFGARHTMGLCTIEAWDNGTDGNSDIMDM